MQSQCSCPKWYDVLDDDYLHYLIDQYMNHPVHDKGFTIYQTCFMCKNYDRITENLYAVDEFTAQELFDELPHPDTLNLHFVGCIDYHD